MYCSNIDGDDCTTPRSIVRAGLEGSSPPLSLSLSVCVMPNLKNTHLTELFYKYGVDVIIEAHEHSYERLWPVYNETVTLLVYPSAFLLSTISRESMP